MSVYNFFRNFFGFPERPPEGGPNREGDIHGERPNEFRNPIWSMDEDDDDDDFRSRPRNHFGFSVDSDPLEMHRFFEQQFDEMLRRFQTFGFGSMFGGDFDSFGNFDHRRALPKNRSSDDDHDEEPKELWKQYLKPGYDRDDLDKKHDSDLDGKIFADRLKKFLRRPHLYTDDQHKSVGDPDKFLARPGDFLGKRDKIDDSPVKPEDYLTKPGTSSKMFGQSVSIKTIHRPDGFVEHHHTVKDSQGNQETTVTRKIGDQSYSVTTKTKANGEQECIKNLINVDEDHLEDFEKKWGSKL